MLENATVARPYAQAVFDDASANKTLSDWSAALGRLSAMVRDADMRRIISDPRIDRAHKEKLIFDIGGDDLSARAQNFVRVLLDANRLLAVPDMAVLFEQMKARTEGKVDVEVVSAYELESAEEKIIVDAVKRRVGKDVSIKASVDSGLIGGVIVRIGDMVIDASLRGRLNQLATRFA